MNIFSPILGAILAAAAAIAVVVWFRTRRARTKAGLLAVTALGATLSGLDRAAWRRLIVDDN